MPHCTFPGNSDMYGLGIRLSFYIQWYTTIISTWLAPTETDGLYLSTAFFVSATFLALILQITHPTPPSTPLKPVEIYIILLLTFSAYLALIPLYFFRLVFRCNGKYDPTRYSRVPASPVFGILNFLLLVAVCGFQMWFWGIRIRVKEVGCMEWGFLFGKIRLDGEGFVVVNLVGWGVLGGFCLGMVGFKGLKRGGVEEMGRRGRGGELDGSKILLLQKINSIFDLLVASIITTATELTIHWNGITDVNDISSAGQTIPLILSISMTIRVFYVFYRYIKHGGSDPFTTIPESREPDELDRFVRLSIPAPRPVVLQQRRYRQHRSRRDARERVLVV